MPGGIVSTPPEGALKIKRDFQHPPREGAESNWRVLKKRCKSFKNTQTEFSPLPRGGVENQKGFSAPPSPQRGC